MRMHGHAEHDPADYVPKEMYEEYSKKDPVQLYENVLLEAGVLDADRAAQIREDARQRPSRPGARRSPTRCPTRATSRRASTPTDPHPGAMRR